ncbi:terminase large subunit domain-containing protein [Bacillus sp. AG4(2022)]|uniref:terminase large subunit domain-containing protein n=1 Tax=Bacillus sp. AG4(2022) TaxID=2962594 RepID=UPI00288170C2|nr:terminase family protein [Bacillus sp. AG4(2022)]MDT0160284.1 terminase family protein [Bacillus sp. AG4(2022)]
MGGYKNYSVKRNKHKNAVGAFDRQRKFNKGSDNLTKSEKLMEGVAAWAAYYISRPDIFAEDYLGLSLKPFQKILLYVMMHYNYTALFASRGLGKTFLTALFCVIICILKPGTKIVIAAGQKGQAMKIVTEKIPELMNMSKTGMLKREIKGSIRTSMNTDDPNVEFLNGSWIKVVAATQGARSARANLLILDEFRMIDPKIYRNVLRRFLASSRQPAYLEKPEFKNKQEYLERNKEIFLTSAYYKFNWSFERFKVFKKAMLNVRKYFVCGFPYQVAIKENLVNKDQLLDELAEDDIDEIGWHMEMDTLFFGESEKAYFKTEEIQETKVLQFPIYKKEIQELIKNKKMLSKKSDNELRILSCDIALLGGDANDSSVFTLISAKKSKNGTRYKRELLNMEAHQGLHPETQALMIRRLFDDYECDYIVLDRQGNGISVYAFLCRKLFDNERKKEYGAFYSINEKDEPKLSGFHIEDTYEEKIFTVSGTEEFNHDIAIDLKDKITSKRLNLLISKNDVREYFFSESWFNNLSVEDQVEILNPYLQTALLENEMVLLERIEHSKYVKLKEQSGKRKDRYSSLAYGNYFISQLEKDLQGKNEEVDLSLIPAQVSALNITL